MHIEFVRAGVVGLVVAGVSFILPAALITLGFAWACVQFQTVPQADALLYGIKFAVIAIIMGVVWRLGKTAAKSWDLIVLGMLVMLSVLLGVNEIVHCLVVGLQAFCGDSARAGGKRDWEPRYYLALLHFQSAV